MITQQESAPQLILKSIYEDPITSKITQLSFFSKAVRTNVTKMKEFVEDMEHRSRFKQECRKKKIKVNKREQVPWPEMTPSQQQIIEEKGCGEFYWHRMIQGPYNEKFSEKLDCVHMGIYRDGLREEWGKMVRSFKTFLTK